MTWGRSKARDWRTPRQERSDREMEERIAAIKDRQAAIRRAGEAAEELATLETRQEDSCKEA